MSDQEPQGNRARSLAFRNEVIVYLHDAGLTAATRPDEPKGPTRAERLQADHAGILGLPWTLAVRCERNIDLSGAQDQVAREAARTGNDLYASIQQRTNHSLQESYVPIPLKVFIEVLDRPAATARERALRRI